MFTIFRGRGYNSGKALRVGRCGASSPTNVFRSIPHNSKCRYGERGAADAVPQLPERCLSRKAGIVRCCLRITTLAGAHIVRPPPYHLLLLRASRSPSPQTPAPQITTHPIKKPPFHLAVRPKMWYSILSKVLLCPNHSKYFSLFLLIRRNIHAKHSDCIRKYNLCRRK